MYRHCIYCSGDLGTNEAVEAFPVGRTLAFDAAKGRLWAVCGKCARWNLASIEERWEPVEAAERLFRDARLRVQSENVGMAKLRDGTRLIRIGAALQGELAAWRYGDQLRRRRTRALRAGAGLAVVVGAVALAGLAMGGVSLTTSGLLWRFYGRPALQRHRDAEVIHTIRTAGTWRGTRIDLRRRDLWGLALCAAPRGLELHLRLVPEEALWRARAVPSRAGERTVILRDADARRVMERAMVALNERGARRHELERAVQVLETAGSAERYLEAAARDRLRLDGGRDLYVHMRTDPNPVAALALEMALHEEQERRAMEGDLSALESAWRDAEGIAVIADRLALEG